MNYELIKPLQIKDIEIPEWWKKDKDRLGYWNDRLRILFFDPIEIYNRIDNLIDPFKRVQDNLNTEILFPKTKNGICRCGCREKGKNWANNSCSSFAYKVSMIIKYGTNDCKVILETYYGVKCQNNTCENEWVDLDHIIPVKHGGGGCWLSNFLPLCKKCHKDKTNKDFKWKEYKPTMQIPIKF